MEMCPVCSKENANKLINGALDGIIYYFCCEQCRTNFMAKPRRFINCCEESDDQDSSCCQKGE